MKRTLYFFMPLFAFIFVGCAGQVTKTAQQSKADIKISEAKADCMTANFKAKAELYKGVNDPKDRQIMRMQEQMGAAMLAMANGGKTPDPCPNFTNSNDVDIVRIKGLTEQIKAALDMGKSTIEVVGKVFMLKVGIDGVVSLVDKAGARYQVAGDFITGGSSKDTFTNEFSEWTAESSL